MKRSFRIFLCLFLGLGMIFGAFAGGQGEGEQKASTGVADEPPLLRIRAASWLVQKAFIKEAADKFEADNPGVKVTFESFDEKDIQKYIIQWSSGKSEMDLVTPTNFERTAAFILKDMLYTFDELGFWEDFSKDDLVPAILGMGLVNGKTYYIPILGEFYWLNINKKMLADAGIADKDGNIPHPDNWDDVLDMAAKTTIGDQSGMSIRLYVGSSITSFYGALKAYRGDVFEDDGTTFVVDTPKSREILSAWRKGVQNNWISTMTFTDSNAGRVAYKAGKVAIILESGSRWPEAAPILGSDNVSPLPMPGGMEGGSMLFGSGFAIPKQSAAPYTAAKFIKEMYLTDVIQSKMMNVYGKQPVLKSAYAFAAHPGWDQMLEAAQHCVPIPHYRGLPKFTNALGDNIQRYLLAQQDLDETIKAVEESLDSIDKRIY